MTIECLSAGILVADHLTPPINHVPAAGELILVDELPLAIGGCAANVAIDLARVGVRVGVSGCVGEDSFGQFVVDTLGRAGVQTEGIRRLADSATSGTLIINVRGQDRRFIHNAGANGHYRAEHISLDEVRAAKVLYIGGYLLMERMDQDALAAVFAEARRAGVTTVLDVVLPHTRNQFERLQRILPHTDVFLPNHDESRAITGLADPKEQALAFHAAGARTVAITCGGEGTILVSRETRLRAGVYPIDFVGGTGAGDAFDAGYILGLLEGASAHRCLELGSALGASCVRGIGATETVFTREEAEEFVRHHRLPVETW